MREGIRKEDDSSKRTTANCYKKNKKQKKTLANRLGGRWRDIEKGEKKEKREKK